jgi:hypothetical protein
VPLNFAVDDAAMTVKKFLFDYTDEGVTAFERKVLKRLFPFYTWTRNNVPLQLEYLLKKPRKFGAISKAHAAWQQGIGPGPDERYLEDWKTEAAPWRIFGTPEKSTHMLMERWLPAADIGKALNWREAKDVPLDLLTPFLKLPLELGTGRNFYMDKPIAYDDYDQRELLGMKMNPYLAHSLRNLRPVGEADWLLRALRGETDKGAALVRVLTGKAYEYDPAERMEPYWRELQREINKLDREATEAFEDGNPERAKRLLAKQAELYERF